MKLSELREIGNDREKDTCAWDHFHYVSRNHWDALLDVVDAAKRSSAIIHKGDDENHQCCADICKTLRRLEEVK